MSGQKVPPPIFTLRGHKSGVTALAQFRHDDDTYLISGDDEGSIFIWSLADFRMLKSYPRLVPSRVQSLKVIHLGEAPMNKVLVIQSRNEGLHLMDLEADLSTKSEQKLLKIAEYPTLGYLFSRGDAIELDNGKALLAYPSCLENYLVTVRVIGSKAVTLQSGTAQRYSDEKEKTCSVFDISLLAHSQEDYYLFAGYEDGFVCIFKICLSCKTSLPILNAEGLKIDLIKKYDLKIRDFVSAFDVIKPRDSDITLICGSPLQSLIILRDKLDDENSQPSIENMALKKQGVSDIAIRPDHKLYAVACWDSSVKLFSLKSGRLLAVLGHHLKQTQQILFVGNDLSGHEYSESRGDANISKAERKFLLCCASMEGTISISDIY